MKLDFDVIVAGGGPAGSSTANFLRQRGRSVLVLERDKFPRFRVGESLLPFNNDLWKELGVFDTLNERFEHKPGATFLHEESGALFTYYFDTALRDGRPYAFQAKRAELDVILLDRARELGADVREETAVQNVRFTPDGVTVESSGGTFTAPLFVDATGRDAMTAGRRQWKRHDDLITTNVALFAAWQGVVRTHGLEEGNIIIGLFDGGWYWVTPLKDGDVSVGFVLEKRYTKVSRGLSREEMYHQVLASLPHLSKIMAGATRVMPVGSQANWSYRSEKFYGERLLLVGDSAAFVDPLFSTGVLLAIQGAKYAAEHADAALRDGDFSAERFASYQQACVAGMDIFKSLVTEFYAENLRRVLMASAVNPTICQIVVSILAGDVYKPSMWHSIVSKAGFSNLPDQTKEMVTDFASSRDVIKAAQRSRQS